MAGNESTTKLLLHFERLGGSSTVIDSAVGAAQGVGLKTISGGGTLASTQVKFGDNAMYCNGSLAAMLKVDATADFSFSNGDMSIDFWAYIRTAQYPHLCAWYLGVGDLFALEMVRSVGSQVEFRLQWFDAGLLRLAIASGTNELKTVIGGWHHYAIERSGQAINLWIDGVIYAAGTLPSTSTLLDFSHMPLYVGGSVATASRTLAALDGYVDEFRIDRRANFDGAGTIPGTNFTPPTQSYMPRLRQGCTGEFGMRKAFKQSASGEFGLARRRYRQSGMGTSAFLKQYKHTGRGGHQISAPFSQSSRGIYAVNGTTPPELRSYRASCRGTHRIVAPFSQSAQGGFAMDKVRYRQSGRGSSAFLMRYISAGRGAAIFMGAYHQTGHGIATINAPVAGYELYHAIGAEPDFAAVPFETFTTLPHTTAAITGLGVHHLVLRRRNSAGLLSQNIDSRLIELDINDNAIAFVPTNPQGVSVAAQAMGIVLVSAEYVYTSDAASQSNGFVDNRADLWAIYLTEGGVDPDPAVDTPTLIAVDENDAVAILDELLGPYTGIVKVIVRTRRSSDGRESTNTNIVSVTPSSTGPAAPTTIKLQRIQGEQVLLA